MPGFKHYPLADIADLQSILRDQYEPTSIVKELIQNADDAGSSQLHLLSLLGYSNATHPLMRGPGMLVLNDGEFRESDREALICIRVGAKGSDQRTIGKFGLGMKSIFHLAECFIYGASSDQPGASGQDICDILNPWHGTGLHDEWDDISSDRHRIISWIRLWSQAPERWFFLWLPFRTPQQLGGKHPISEAYPTFEELSQRSLLTGAAECMGFLRSLRAISVWQEGPVGCIRRDSKIELESCSGRRIYLDLKRNSPNAFNGNVLLDQDSSPQQLLRYAALEELLDQPELRRLEDDKSHWPSRVTLDSNTGKPILTADKAAPHAALLLAVRSAIQPGRGKLCIRRAVFLPLVSTLDEVPVGGEFDCDLLLHGCYFLDGGRKDIYPKTGNPWNARLEDFGNLPLLPEALEHAVNSLSLYDEIARNITNGLNASQFINTHIGSVCRKNIWLFRISSDGAHWKALPANTVYRVLPSPPPERQDLPVLVLPTLPAIANQYVVSWNDWPRLAHTSPVPWGAILHDLLASTDAKTLLGSTACLDYVIELIASDRELLKPETLNLDKTIMTIAHEALQEPGLLVIREHGPSFRRLISLASPKCFVSVAEDLLDLDVGRLLLHEQGGLGISSIILPNDLAPNSTGKLSLSEVTQICRWLSRQQFTADISKLAVGLLQVTEALPADRKNACGSIELFSAHNYALKKEEIVSWNRLDELYQKGQLYSGGSFAQSLQGVLQSGTIYRLVDISDRSISKMIFSDRQLSACEFAACIDFLGRAPALTSGIEQRGALLGRLLQRPETVSEDDWIRSTRFLLHGSVPNINDTGTPLLLEGGLEESVWALIVRLVVRRNRSEWRWLARDLAKLLSPIQCDILKITTADQSSAEALLKRDADLSWLTNEQLADDLILEILKNTRDFDLWKRLPFHETADGRRIPIDNIAVYMEGAFSVPPQTPAGVVVLRRPKDRVLREVYRGRVREWDAEAAIRSAIEDHEPGSYWELILSALKTLLELDDGMPVDLRMKLRTTAWVPGPSGPVTAARLIDLPEAEEELERCLSTPGLNSDLISYNQVNERFRKHRAAKLFRSEILPDVKSALAAMSSELRKHENFRIGAFVTFAQPGHLAEFLSAFETAGEDLLRILPILRSLDRVEHYRSYLQDFVRELAEGIDPARVIEILIFLQARHSRKLGDPAALFRIHRCYLNELVDTAESGEGLQRRISAIKLMNQRGEWKDTDRLCLDAEGIDDAFLLERGQAESLAPKLVGHQTRQAITQHAPSITYTASELVLKEYFQPWNGLVPRELIGGFLAILGNDREIVRLAASYLEPKFRLTILRSRLDWTPMPVGLGGTLGDVAQAMSEQRFNIRVVDPTKQRNVEVISLVGKALSAALSEHFSTLLVGEISGAAAPGVGLNELILRKCDPRTRSKEVVFQLILETTRTILRRVFRQTPGNLEGLWRELSESEQLDLEIAQQLLLENAVFYLRQLGDRHLEPIKHLLRNFDDLRYNEAETERDLRRVHPSYIAELHQKKARLRDELRSRIESDTRVQEAVLNAVKNKICNDLQYQIGSIPFEIFQNADDAAIELQDSCPPDSGTSIHTKLVICHEGDTVSFVHWGRPINQFAGPGLPADEGRRRGFHRDLEKMLVLSASDKEIENNLTGKFGLGFKTVFLFSDRPQVLSGNLSFEVVGGFYPRALKPADHDRLQARLASLDGCTSPGTLISLTGQNTEDLLRRFVTLADISMVFAKRIHSCEIRTGDKSSSPVAWEGRPVGQAKHVVVGRLNPLNRDTRSACNVLLLRAAGGGGLLLRVGGRGFERMPDNIPTFWVTAPTQIELHAGFMVNGPFHLDVGRAQLSRDIDSNKSVASSLGEGFGQALLELYEEAQNWQSVQNALELAADCSPLQFWKSLWELFAPIGASKYEADPGSPAQILRWTIWSSSAGMGRLLKECKILPTNLAGNYNCLTQLPAINWITCGLLDEQEVFSGISQCAFFGARYAKGTIISEKRTSAIVKRELGNTSIEGARTLRLRDVVCEVINGKAARPETAEEIGQVVCGDFLRAWRFEKEHKSEIEELQMLLSDLDFATKGGLWRPPKEIVLGMDDDDGSTDEILRSRFAPDAFVLAESYGNAGRAFFKVCRQYLNAPATVLVEWGIAAEQEVKRYQFLRYLLDGDLGREVADQLRKRPGTWLHGLPDSAILCRFEDYEKLQLLGMLGFTRIPTPSPPLRPHDSCQNILKHIYEWWSEERSSRLRTYENDVYAAGRFPLSGDGQISTDYAKQAWLELILTSIAQTIGWSSDTKNRTFVRLCAKKGWLALIASAPSDPASWLLSLDRHIDDQIEDFPFYQWMQRLLGLFVIARRLDSHVNAFLETERIPSPFDISQITASRSSAIFQGGGPDAPPITRILGMGVFFLMRELARHGHITNRIAYRHCYVPSAPVRRLLEAIGGEDCLDAQVPRWSRSAAIFTFLSRHMGEEKCTFHTSFDIPLKIVGEDPALWNRFLNQPAPVDLGHIEIEW